MTTTHEVKIVDTPEIVKARDEAQSILRVAKELANKIVDGPSYRAACNYLVEIKRRRKWWSEFNKPEKRRIDQLKRFVLDRERQIDEPWNRAESLILRPAIQKYEMEQEKIRREAEQRMREEARKRAEDERLSQASELEKMGEKEAAEQIISAPIQPQSIVLPEPEKPQGISFRENWRFEVINENEVPDEYWVIDASKLRKVVTAFKGQTKIPGIRIWSEKEPVVRT